MNNKNGSKYIYLSTIESKNKINEQTEQKQTQIQRAF